MSECKAKRISAPSSIIPPAIIKEDITEIQHKIALETINIDKDIAGQNLL